MQKAYLVISKTEKKLVNACEVESSDYSRIFQCYQCNATLTLRQEYIRSGHLVRASFVHPEGDVSDCVLRVSFNITSSKEFVFGLIGRGQSSKKLEGAFIECLKHFVLGYRQSIILGVGECTPSHRLGILRKLHLKRQIEYNEKPGKVHPDPDLLLKASSIILKSRQSQSYINQEINKLQLYLNSEQKAIEYFSKKQSAGKPVETLIKNHSTELRLITNFIVRGTSDEFRKQFLRIILWGDSDLPVYVQHLWTEEEKKSPKKTYTP
jgi:uncharacterized C2H2 Zn-finger protein